MAIMWLYFLESVPTLQKSLAWGWMFLLAFTAAVMMLRTKRFSVALGLAMAVPILGGFPFVYLGVYMGGTLPFSEPGPSLQEVFRQYLPFLAMVLSFVLGPQLAVKLRAVGYQCKNVGGKVFYRLALGGILLGLAMTMMQWERGLTDFDIPLKVMQVLFIASAMLYLLGFVLLAWSVKRNEELSDKKDLARHLVALFILLPFVPLVILHAVPYGVMSYTESWLLSLAVIGWVFVAAWMVKE
jgi:membrane-anchored protein YejM (alkaline phosphatase superfamily)